MNTKTENRGLLQQKPILKITKSAKPKMASSSFTRYLSRKNRMLSQARQTDANTIH